MPRLKHADTGVTVNVSNETAALLDSEWVAVGEQAKTAKRTETSPKGSGQSAGGRPPRSATPDATWKVAELTAYATEHKIALGDNTTKADILTVIANAKPSESPAGDADDDSADEGDDDSADE
jgi:hypothetical protein